MSPSEVRDRYIRLLADGGVVCPSNSALNKSVFFKTVDNALDYYGARARECVSSETAVGQYKAAKQLAGTRTRLSCGNSGIILDCILPGAYSNKAILQRVIYKGKPYIFKFPQSSGDSDQVNSVISDYIFCKKLKKDDTVLLPGLVHYDTLTIKKQDESVIQGTISSIYAFSLQVLHRPLPASFLITVVKRVADTLKEVHDRGWVICDLKPDNMYMSVEGLVDVGDFGGALEIGETIKEHTPEYLTEDLLEAATVVPAVDFVCLATSTLKLLDIPYKRDTIDDVRSAVTLVEDTDLKSLLEALLNKCHVEILAHVDSEDYVSIQYCSLSNDAI